MAGPNRRAAPNARLPETLLSPPATRPSEDLTAPYVRVPTACQYCVVGCGYEAHVWDPQKDESDYGSTLPPLPEQGLWVSPAMTERVLLDGKDRLCAVLPDPKCPMSRGNHSARGGTQGRDLVVAKLRGARAPASAKRDSVRERITTPYVRTRKGWKPITMKIATEVVAELVREAADGTPERVRGTGRVLRFKRPGGLGVKLFEYQGLENTYVATKLFYQLIGTPNVAYHDRPSVANNTQGFRDSGIDPHGYSYADVWDSDVLLLAGSNPYECQSVFFANYMTGKKIIVLDPRRTLTADYAIKTNGLHLQPKVLGADALVLNALCRHIVERRYKHGKAWGKERVPSGLIATDAQLAAARAALNSNPPDNAAGPDKYRRALFHMSRRAFNGWIVRQPDLKKAAKVTGISLRKLKLAARWLSGPVAGLPKPRKRKVSLIFEKGLIWNFNYASTAAFANLALLLGSVLRPKDEGAKGVEQPILGVSGRAGGHQKGWAEVRYDVRQGLSVGYPYYNATDRYQPDQGEGYLVPNYLDAHLVGSDVAPTPPGLQTSQDPDVRLLWVIGANAVGQMGNAAAKWNKIKQRRRDTLPVSECKTLPASERKRDILTALKRRWDGDATGLIVVQQDIYPNPTTQFADIVLPACAWGEHDTTRYTGERRLRLYGRFQDPPRYGKARPHETAPPIRAEPDWKIFQSVAKALLDGFVKGHGLPNEYCRRGRLPEKTALGATDFGWESAADVFRELANHSRLTKEFRLDLLEGDTVPRGHARLRARGTRGFVLPLVRDKDKGKDKDSIRESERVPVEEQWDFDGDNGRKITYGPYAFVQADWTPHIEEAFKTLKRRQDEFWICNGRINELWNSLFTHIRNATVRARWPDTLPGTVLEMDKRDADALRVKSGDIVSVTCDDIAFAKPPNADGLRAGTFNAVVSVQPRGTLRRRVVFAYFSYPVTRARPAGFPYRRFTTEGYVNNVTTGYIDPVNPIAAVKLARGRIEPTGRRVGESICQLLGAPRSIAFDRTMVRSETERRRWKVRELVVSKGLPRAGYHDQQHRPHVADLVRDPDRCVDLLSVRAGGPELRERLRKALPQMTWQPEWPDGAPADSWTQQEKRLLGGWLASLERRRRAKRHRQR